MGKQCECALCKAPFIKKNNFQKYCSVKCYNDFNKIKRAQEYSINRKSFVVICKHCKKEFNAVYKMSRFCSKECNDAYFFEKRSLNWVKSSH